MCHCIIMIIISIIIIIMRDCHDYDSACPLQPVPPISPHLRPISLLRLPRFVDSTFPGNPPWA